MDMPSKGMLAPCSSGSKGLCHVEHGGSLPVVRTLMLDVYLCSSTLFEADSCYVSVVSTHQDPLRRAKAPLPKISLELLTSSGKSCRQAVPWWAHATELILSGVELCAIHACRTDNCRALF